MHVTVIIKDFSDVFYNGGHGIPAFLAMTPAEKFEKLKRMSYEKRVKMKIESGQFRDAVDLNHMMKSPVNITFKLEPRRGYKLVTFEITKA